MSIKLTHVSTGVYSWEDEKVLYSIVRERGQWSIYGGTGLLARVDTLDAVRAWIANARASLFTRILAALMH